MGIPVFLCLKLNIFSPEKGSSGNPVSIAFCLCCSNIDVSFCFIWGGISSFELVKTAEKTYHGQKLPFHWTVILIFLFSQFNPNGTFICFVLFFFKTGLWMSHSKSSLTPCIIQVKELCSCEPSSELPKGCQMLLRKMSIHHDKTFCNIISRWLILCMQWKERTCTRSNT